MEKLEGKNIMNSCISKVKEILTNIKYHTKKIIKNKSYNNKDKFSNSVYDIDECEKYKLAILFQYHTGKRLY